MKSKIALERSSRNVNAVRPQQLLPSQNMLEPRPTIAPQNGPTMNQDPRRPTVNTNVENSEPRGRRSIGELRSQPMSAATIPTSAPSQSRSCHPQPSLPQTHAQGSFSTMTGSSTRVPLPAQQNHSAGQAQTGPLIPQPAHQPPQKRHSLQTNSFFPWPNHFPPQIVPPDPGRRALHQARLATPQLLLKSSETILPVAVSRRAYRYVSEFALPPQIFNSALSTHQWKFNVPQDLAALSPTQVRIGNALTTDEAWGIQQNNILFRLRCVKWDVVAADKARDWITSDTYWPPHVYYECNQELLEERRKLGHGKDLPIGISSYIRAGANSLQITCNMDKTIKPETFCLAVEIVTVSMHDKIKQDYMQRTVPRDDTVAAIAGQLSSDDEEIHMTSMTIGLLDPMLASKIWEIPVRGPNCRHREAFDLETFLQSRPSRPGDDVTTADAWRCPICGSDARPHVLLVDEWLVDVRKGLDAKGRLDARAINVEANGTWTIVEESRVQKASKGKEKTQPVSLPANVMELDSD